MLPDRGHFAATVRGTGLVVIGEAEAALRRSGASAEALAKADAPSPALAAWTGERGAVRTIESLTADIRNKHTRRAYHRAVARFAGWCMERGLALGSVQSPHVAAYVELLASGGDPLPRPLSPLSVKLHLAALKHWFDWLVTGHVLPVSPAAAVRGPRYSQTTGQRALALG